MGALVWVSLPVCVQVRLRVPVHVQQARWSAEHLGLARAEGASGSQLGTPGGSALPSREPSCASLTDAAALERHNSQRGEGR